VFVAIFVFGRSTDLSKKPVRRMATPELGYWNIRGLANPIRYLLEHVGQKYEFKDWFQAPAPGWRGGDKYKMNLEFPNLPYYIDGNVRLTQSNAILRYLARKHDMTAKTEEELQQQDVIDGVLGDIRGATSNLVYRSENFEEDKIKFRSDTLEPLVKELNGKLAGKDYLVGNRLTYNDFILFEVLDVQQMMFANLLDQFPNLKSFHSRIKNLKGVKEFLQSDRNPTQINGSTAKWGGQPNSNRAL